MTDPLRLGVGICGCWTLAALAGELIGARAYGTRPLHAPPAADPRRAIFYAFGAGMSPTAKESVREHLPAYFTGMGYHLGTFASIILLVSLMAGVTPEGPTRTILAAAAGLGAVCGLGLLARRATRSQLRGLSSPDDYISNALVTGFAALAFAAALAPTARPVLFVESMALLLYIPLGKIRHCFFFFTTRAAMAATFGRRGTLPPARHTGASRKAS